MNNDIKKILFFVCLANSLSLHAQQSDKTTKWSPKYDFNIHSFQDPPVEFGPFARWWWPGNDVTKEELKREINLFADNHFGGVEIQPLNLFVPGSKEDRARAVTWDSPEYYENLRSVMDEARKRGLTVDMTDGSGWPPGGPHLTIDDGFLNLQFSKQDVKGGSQIAMAVPTIANATGVSSRLEAVLAVKELTERTHQSGTIALDPNFTLVITSLVKNDSLYWKVPDGDWTIIAFWSKPSGEKGMVASPAPGYVVNHFDSVKVLKNYNHLFGERTGLQPYFGNPMRAIFNDSYEFEVDRFYSYDFISYFKMKRGYDITPWLPAEMQKGYNYASYKRPPASPDFYFSPQDWRLKYDYDLTLSELLGERFFNTSRNWMEPKGLLHRTQAYGLNMDMIAQAGLASIPETESMLGPEANLKIMTSGGHLYNRPVESAESVVFINRAYTTTPQKIRLAVDKLFAAGVNQIIYHGVPYRYSPDELGELGWYPFSTPIIPMINFSSNLGEGNIFWKYQKKVNEYVSRTQYALRAGKPHADLLIYFPFMDVDGLPENPEEIMAAGYLKDVEGPLPVSKDPPNIVKEKWAQTIYPLINKLEANGITWDWVNDLSIQEIHLDKLKQINIRGNIYQGLIIAGDSMIQLKTAEKISRLAGNGMKLMAMGMVPDKQPSFLNWQENDRKTAAFIRLALKAGNSIYIRDLEELETWLKTIKNDISFNGRFVFTRQVQRNMSDGSRIRFIWNKSNEWKTISLILDKKFQASYWLNTEDGAILTNKTSQISYQIAPYGSVILYASVKTVEYKNSPTVLPEYPEKPTNIIALENWDIKVDAVEIKNSPLFDWKTNDRLKFSSAEGIYTTSFSWNPTSSATRYFLDLGKVCYTADVFINDTKVGARIFSPYMLDISSFLTHGTNKIEVRVTTGQLNGFIGKALQGDKRYKQFSNKEDQLMSAGLIGPVQIKSN